MQINTTADHLHSALEDLKQFEGSDYHSAVRLVIIEEIKRMKKELTGIPVHTQEGVVAVAKTQAHIMALTDMLDDEYFTATCQAHIEAIEMNNIAVQQEQTT